LQALSFILTAFDGLVYLLPVSASLACLGKHKMTDNDMTEYSTESVIFDPDDGFDIRDVIY
jgi:hypothetical protein